MDENQMAATSVASLDLAPHIKEALAAERLETVGDVAAYRQQNGTLTKIKGIGEASEEQIALAIKRLADDQSKPPAQPPQEAQQQPPKPRETKPTTRQEVLEQEQRDAQRQQDKENADRVASQAEALRTANELFEAQSKIVAELQRDREKIHAQMAELERKMIASQRLAGMAVEKPILNLTGPANPEAEKRHRQAIWPKDTERVPEPLFVKTYMVEPVGASVEAGLSKTLVSMCWDAVDAKAAFFRDLKPEQHNLPLNVYEVSRQQVT